VTNKHTTKDPWTEELTRLVERLWMEGKSANQIGKQLGRSRNSVIGKVHRMGLNNVVRQRPTLTPSRFNPRFGPPKPPKPRAKPVRSPPAAIKDNVVPLPPRPLPKPPEGGVSLLSLQYGIHCAYPVSGRGADTAYCGGGTGGHTYCAAHRRVMYEKPKKVHASSTFQRR
jgi:GcrA cell cycle regulator